MKDLSKYISERLIIDKNYNLNADSVNQLYTLMLDNYTEKHSWGHNKKNVIIGNFFIDISSIWFKDTVTDVHKFTNWYDITTHDRKVSTDNSMMIEDVIL